MGHLHRFQRHRSTRSTPDRLERLDFADLEGDKAVLEIDMSKRPGEPGFVTRHVLETRPMLDLTIPCGGCDQTAVMAGLEHELAGKALAGAVVRVRLEELQRDVWGALDFGRFDELFADCLHHMIHVGRIGLHAGPDHVSQQAELEFDTWAWLRVPDGLDPETVIAIAQNHLKTPQHSRRRRTRREALEPEPARIPLV